MALAANNLSILAGARDGKTFAARFVVERWRAEGVEERVGGADGARRRGSRRPCAKASTYIGYWSGSRGRASSREMRETH